MVASYQGRPAVVVGGLGPFGAAAARRLVDLGARVSVLDALTSAGADLALLAGYEQRIDVRLVDPDLGAPPRDLLRHAAIVFHVPQPPASGVWSLPARGEEGVRLAALALLEGIRTTNPACRLVLASTRWVYGRPQALPASEAAPCRPITLPGIERLATEHLYRAFAEVHDLSVTILRFTTVYGATGDRRGAALPDRFLARARAGEPLVVYRDDDTADDYVHLDDAVTALVSAGATAEARGVVMNYGAGRAWSPLDVARTAVAVAGTGRVDERDGRPLMSSGAPFTADISLARQILGLESAAPLETALGRGAGA